MFVKILKFWRTCVQQAYIQEWLRIKFLKCIRTKKEGLYFKDEWQLHKPTALTISNTAFVPKGFV